MIKFCELACGKFPSNFYSLPTYSSIDMLSEDLVIYKKKCRSHSNVSNVIDCKRLYVNIDKVYRFISESARYSNTPTSLSVTKTSKPF